ncbi:MAG TPA: acyl-CoA dehydrogenase family protein [Longimicrobiales bacterium]|nr:acyl-CoA dehydrogenase family protein [Longimicrobiales bacterium]
MSEVSEQLQEIRALAREFAAAELRPHVERWDQAGALGAEAITQVAELGFFGMLLPEAHGGMGFDRATWAAAIEELAWGEPAVALTLVCHARLTQLVQQHGAPPLQTRWLEALGAGAASGSIAIAEDEADALRTTAARVGEDWHITGSKRWVSGTRPGGALLVLARADAGPTLFLVPVDDCARGVRDATLGLRALDVRTVSIDARVSDDARIGEPGAAGALLDGAVALECTGVAAVAVGIARAALEHAVAYAGEREQFGQPLREFEGLQLKLADMATRTAAAAALVAAAARAGDADAARKAKVFAADTAMAAATEAVQIFGGYGYMRDYPVEKLMRDGRAMSLLGGGNAQHQLAIARALYAE